MNGTKIASVSGASGRRVNRPSWQEEIGQLHVNFFVLDALIRQPVGSCPQIANQYLTLQQTIADTLETLLEELERQDNCVVGSCTQLLRKHAVIMRGLNARVDALINGVAV